MLNLNHKNLDVWKKSKQVTKEVYILCELIPDSERYNLISQMKRASVSVVSNIAEGYARNSKLETKRFLDIARSSLVELDTQFELCVELDLLKKEDLENVSDLLGHTFAMLSNLMKTF